MPENELHQVEGPLFAETAGAALPAWFDPRGLAAEEREELRRTARECLRTLLLHSHSV
jgi:hypothetical protein